MLILGVTGGVATGKSTVTRMLSNLGAEVVSADEIARDLLAPGTTVTQAIAAAFPNAVLDAADRVTIDRVALRHAIFSDPNARKQLDALTHPAIIDVLKTDIARLRSSDDAPVAAVEIPLLFEANLISLVNQILVVACSSDIQIDRLCERWGIDPTDAVRHIASQLPLQEKINRADYVIDTDGTLDETSRQVENLWRRLVECQY